MWCLWHWNNMTPIALSMAHHTNTSTGTSTRAKCHIIPLNNHLKIQLQWCHWWHHQLYIIATYMTKTNMHLKCHICHTCQLVHVHIWHSYVSLYSSYIPTAINNVNRILVYIHFTLLVHASEQICMPHCTCISLHCYCSLHIVPTLLHIQVKQKKKKKKKNNA